MISSKRGMVMVYRCWLGILVMAELALSGCVVKVYQKEMPREDIIVEGNQGYLVGAPPKQGYSVQKKTRKIFVTEIELVKPKELHVKYLGEEKTNVKEKNVLSEAEKEHNYGYIYRKETKESDNYQQKQKIEEGSQQVGTEDVKKDMIRQESKTENKASEEKGSEEKEFLIYKVQKGDTLQKISYKFYGKYSLWPVIFKANKDKLEHPDSIYVGQELKIPVLDGEK